MSEKNGNDAEIREEQSKKGQMTKGRINGAKMRDTCALAGKYGIVRKERGMRKGAEGNRE